MCILNSVCQYRAPSPKSLGETSRAGTDTKCPTEPRAMHLHVRAADGSATDLHVPDLTGADVAGGSGSWAQTPRCRVSSMSRSAHRKSVMTRSQDAAVSRRAMPCFLQAHKPQSRIYSGNFPQSTFPFAIFENYSIESPRSPEPTFFSSVREGEIIFLNPFYFAPCPLIKNFY